MDTDSQFISPIWDPQMLQDPDDFVSSEQILSTGSLIVYGKLKVYTVSGWI